MGFLRAFSRAGYGSLRRWRSGSCLEERFHVWSSSGNAVLPGASEFRLGGDRGISCGRIDGTSGTFSGGRFIVTTSTSSNKDNAQDEDAQRDEDAQANEDAEPNEDADPDAQLNDTLSTEEQGPYDKLLVMFKYSPLRSPVVMITQWQENGHKLTGRIVLRLCKWLRTRGRHTQAHQLMKWVLETKPVELWAKLYELAILAAWDMDKAHICKKIFDGMPPEKRTPAACTALVNAYADRNQAKRAEEVLESYAPTTAQPFNALMLMYLKLFQDEKAVDIYERFKQSGLKPTDMTLLLLAKYSRRLGVEVDKTVADAVLTKTLDELETKRDRLNAIRNVLLAYAYMHDEKGVHKAWNVVEGLERIPAYVYGYGIEAYGIIGKMDKVKELANRVPLENRRGVRFYPVLIHAYATNGMMDRAVGIIDSLKGSDQLNFACYTELISGYLTKNDKERAVEKLKEALQLKDQGSRPNYLIVRKVLPVLQQLKDVDTTEALFAKYIRGWKDTTIYNGLLKVYIEAEKPLDVAKFKKRMKKARVPTNDETEQLLEKIKSLNQEQAAASEAAPA